MDDPKGRNMTTTAASLRRELGGTLAERGHLIDPAWRAAIENAPRELFLGSSFYRPSGTEWEPVHRDQLGVEEWLRLVYSDTTWVTQVDGIDAADAPGPLAGRPTSSSTLPSLVVRMLELADLRDGDKVLEIGTGSGYSTVILCHRLAEERVFSVEYDPDLAALAADRIHAAGFTPTLVTGDGLQGHKDGADYDAIVATCSVRGIPRSWLWQLRDGGTITTTISGWMLASGLIRLTMGEDGTATGRFTGDTIGYILARPHERPPRPQLIQHPGTTRATLVDPALIETWAGHFLAQLAAPSAELVSTSDSVILVDVATGSQAWTEPAGRGWIVHQHGPLRLWDQVEDALTTWKEAGAPDQSAFGMTVTDDTQTVWLGDPSGPSWQLPA